MRLPSLVAWTVLAAIAVASGHSLPNLAIFAGVLSAFVLLASIRTRRVATVRKVISMTLPLAVPLLFLHGIVNPSYPQSFHLWAIPVRIQGLTYGGIVSLRILVLSLAATLWFVSEAQMLFWESIRMRLPLGLVLTIALALAMAAVIRRRAVAVAMAQQARGVPVRGNIVQRARSLTAIVLPIVVTTVVEAEQRGRLLGIRGFGTGTLSAPPTSPNRRDIAIDILGAIAAAAILLLT
jgi:energy-coupling factor transport system permease protein